MNANSLQYSYIQNQQQSSWIDDPFDLKESFKGIMNVNHQRNLEDYTRELVSNYGTYDCNSCEINLSDIPLNEQYELARLYIEYTGRDISECVNGNDFSIENGYTCALLSMLKNDCDETRQKFAQITQNNIVSYYADVLQDELDRQCEDFINSLHNELEMYSQQDNEHGDIIWGRF